MNSSNFTVLLALIGGMLLAIMIKLNSELAAGLTPVHASWFAHCIGAMTALVLMMLVSKVAQLKRAKTQSSSNELTSDSSQSSSSLNSQSAPLWSYLGGLPGALVVIFASITINSELGFSATLVLGLLGQVVFSLIVDHLGLFGMIKKSVNVRQFLPVLCICTGCLLIIFQRSQ